jgi:F-type H+-transporting ATPase subunit epsilon
MSTTTLQVDIVTQEEQLFSDPVSQISLPALDGEITLLPDHQPLMTALGAGEVTIWQNGSIRRMIISPGFLQIADNKATVLVDSAVREEALSEQAAEEARLAAEAAMDDTQSETEVAMTLGTIERTIMEMRAIRKGRGPGRHATPH